MLGNAVETDEKILSTLYYRSGRKREDIMRATGIKRTTVYDSLVRLELKGKTRRENKRIKKIGRPVVLWFKTGENW